MNEKFLQEKDLQKLKSIELEMLKCFAEICAKHNLRYFMLAGSCLGAVRHKGFIPWDDDIDVGMPRKDYEKFLEVAQADLPEHLFLQTGKTDKMYPLNFAKIRNSTTTFVEASYKKCNMNHGVYIDVFPMDGYKKTKRYKIITKIYGYLVSCTYDNSNKRKSIKRRIGELLLFTFFPDYTKVRDKKDAIMKKYDYDKFDKVIAWSGAWADREIMPKEYFGNGSKGVFEGVEVTLPEKYELYLTRLYDDYMQLPPEEQRKPHHYCEKIDLDNPYTKYKNYTY